MTHSRFSLWYAKMIFIVENHINIADLVFKRDASRRFHGFNSSKLLFFHFASFHTTKILQPCNVIEWITHSTFTLWYALMIFIVDKPYKHWRFSFLARRVEAVSWIKQFKTAFFVISRLFTLLRNYNPAMKMNG